MPLPTYLPVMRGQVQRAIRAETLSVLTRNWRAGLINSADVAGYVRVIDEGNFPTDKSLIVDPVRQAIVDFQTWAPANLGPSAKPIGMMSGLEGLEGFLGSIWKGVKKVAGTVYKTVRGVEQKKAQAAIEYHAGVTPETFAPTPVTVLRPGVVPAAAVRAAAPVGISAVMRSPVVLIGLGLAAFMFMQTIMQPGR